MTEQDRSIRSFREEMQEEFKPKRFTIKTYGACGANSKPLILELDCDFDMWKDGVGRLIVGDEKVYFDVIELINYLRTSVK